MYICMCAGVTDVEVRACVLAGARTVAEVGDRCEAGTGCGSCQERIHTILTAMVPVERRWQTLSRSA